MKWHHPIGLLFDLYSRAKEALVEEMHGKEGLLAQDEADAATNTADLLPWKLTLHFSKWPVGQLVPLDENGTVLPERFNNSLKEASYIRHGTGKVIMALGKEETTALWEAVEKSMRCPS